MYIYIWSILSCVYSECLGDDEQLRSGRLFFGGHRVDVSQMKLVDGQEGMEYNFSGHRSWMVINGVTYINIFIYKYINI